jgi:hypothetical protein
VALLASQSEHVQVELRDPVVVSGHDWTGDEGARRRLEQFATTASQAGMKGTVEISEDLAQVLLGLRTRSASGRST